MANFAISFGIGLGLQLLGAALTPPQKVGKLENKKLPDSSYGSAIPKGYGIYNARGILVAAPENLREKKTRRGKIGGKTIEYTYSATLGYIFSQGEVAIPLQLKLNGDVVMDFLSTSDNTLRAAQSYYDYINFYPGSGTQAVDAELAAIDTPCPAYRGTSLIVFPDLQLTERFGNRPPLAEAVLATEGSLTSVSGTSATVSPLTWTSATGTVQTTGDLVWVKAAGYLAHLSGGPALQYFVSSNSIPLTGTQFIELFFSATTSPSFGLSANNSVSAAPSNLDVLIQVVAGQLTFSRPSVAGSAITVPFPAGGNSVVLQRQANTVRLLLNGVDIGGQSYSTTPVYLKAFLGIGDAAYSIHGSDLAITLSRAVVSPIALKDIIVNICSLRGVTAEADEITDLVTGIELRGGSPKEWLSQLQEIYGFFMVDTGLGLKFLNGLRPPPVRVFDSLEKFGTVERYYTWEQTEDFKLPYEVEVSYYDLAAGQDKNAHFRIDVQDPDDIPNNTQKMSISTGATLSEEEARGIGALNLMRLRQEREGYKTRTTFENADLEPGDTIVLPYLGRAQEFLITKLTYGANYMVELEMARYSRGPWLLKKTPASVLGTTTASRNFPAQLFAAQLPQIESTDPATPIYWAVSRSNPNWQSAALSASADNGATFLQVGQTFNQATIGVASSTLPGYAGGGGTYDANATLRVKVSGQLSTITQALFDGGSRVNWLVVGTEIVKFKQATLLANTGEYYYYRLDGGLYRGLLGTPMGGQGLLSPVALVSDLDVLNRAVLGNPGETIQLKLFLDGAASSKLPYPLLLS